MLELTFLKVVIMNTMKLLVFTLIEGSDCTACMTNPQQISPVEENTTIVYTHSADISYQ